MPQAALAPLRVPMALLAASILIAGGCASEVAELPDPVDTGTADTVPGDTGGVSDSSGLTDAGNATGDSGSTIKDGGSATSDAGSTGEDAGGASEDIGSGDKDAGTTTADAGEPAECKVDDDCAAIVGALGDCQKALCESGSCAVGNKANDTVCEDGDGCTSGDVCLDGQCTSGSPVDCDDQNPCTDDKCDPGSGTCANVDVTDGTACGSGQICSKGQCVSADACSTEADGAKCEDGDPCTVDDTCKTGKCTAGSTKACDDGNACTTDTCKSGSGCFSEPVADGGKCDDGDSCTTKDECLKGQCVGSGCSKNACGDGKCSAADGENCGSCPQDCKKCVKCGDGTCNAADGEDCQTCGQDCGACKATCGDNKCDKDGQEDCSSCPLDCGKCVKLCGNGVCDADKGETCALCAADCKSGCQAVCGNGKCETGESSQSCPKDCGQCDKGACCDVATKTLKPKFAKCGTKALKVEFKCAAASLLKRTAYAGCVGTSATECKAQPTTYSWTKWTVNKKCSSGEVCDPNKKACVKVSQGECSAGACCDVANKKLRPKRYKCGTTTVKTTHKCSSNTLLSVPYYAGCTGKSATACSSSVFYLSLGKPKVVKKCTSTEKCNALKKTCDASNPKACSAGVCCDLGKGEFKAKYSKCGTTVEKTIYACKDNNVWVRDSYAGCSGTSATSCSKTYPAFDAPKLKTKCAAGTACNAKTGACDKVTTPQCKTGTCCDLTTKQYKPSGTQCSKLIAKTEYKCDGLKLQRRTASPGCSGSSQLCSYSSKNYAWTSWATTTTCKSGQKCDAVAKKCTTGTVAQCVAGKCCNTSTKKYKAAGTKCGTFPVKYEYKCEGQLLKRRYGYAGCSGTSALSCSKDPKHYSFSKWLTYRTCAKGQVCNASKKTCATVAACKAGTCCDVKTGKYKPKTTKCSSIPATTQYQCLGLTLRKRTAYHGCSGTSALCTSTPSNYTYSSWSTVKTCSKGQVCDAKLKTCKTQVGCTSSLQCKPIVEVCKAGKCVPSTTGCKTGVCCNTVTGQPKPKGTKCSSTIQAWDYDCSGQLLRKRPVYRGCNGSSVLICSSYSSNYSYGGWSSVKSCLKGYKCNDVQKTCDKLAQCTINSQCSPNEICSKGQCIKNPAYQCSAGSCCDWKTKKYRPKNYKCSTSKAKTEYRCVGLALQRRHAYRGCSGNSASCSYSSSNYAWGSWSTTKVCTLGKVCDDDPAGCFTPKPKCSAGTCCDPAKGYKPKGTKCNIVPMTSEAKCFGNASKTRLAYMGCSGSSSLCSTSSSNYVWSSWSSGKSCTYGCDTSNGLCKTGKCSSGTCCSTITKTFWPKGFKCGKTIKKTEYACIGGHRHRRYAYKGCNGKSSSCSSLSSNYWYSSWAKIQTCTLGCDSATKKCKGGACSSGSCCNTLIKLYSPKGWKCASSIGTLTRKRCTTSSKGTDYLVTEKGTYLCDGKKSTCPKDKTQVSWAQSAPPLACPYGCDSTKLTCKAAACPPGGANVCCNSDGTYRKKGTKCPTSLFPVKTEFKCSTTSGKSYAQSRVAYLGCSGSGKTCSGLSSNYVWTSWSSKKACAFGCSTSGGCKSSQCTSGTCCNTFIKAYMPKGTKCGSTSKGSYYKCTTVGSFKYSQKYTKYPGCSGTSSSCSTSSSNYAHVKSTLIPCAGGCNTSTGQCIAKKCTSGSCCTTSGQYFPKNAKCGGTAALTPVSTQYKCYKSSNGSYYQQIRYAYKGCSGSSASCQSSSTYYNWTSWSGTKKCAWGCSGTKCKATQCTSGTCCHSLYKTYLPKGTKCSSTVRATTYSCSCSIAGCWSQKKVRYSACSGSSTACYAGSSTTGYTNSGSPTFCPLGCGTGGKCK